MPELPTTVRRAHRMLLIGILSGVLPNPAGAQEVRGYPATTDLPFVRPERDLFPGVLPAGASTIEGAAGPGEFAWDQRAAVEETVRLGIFTAGACIAALELSANNYYEALEEAVSSGQCFQQRFFQSILTSGPVLDGTPQLVESGALCDELSATARVAQ